MADQISNKMEETASGSNVTHGGTMQLLRYVMDKTITTYIKNLELIKPLSGVNLSVLKHLHKETKLQFEKNIKCEIEQSYAEENIECLLDTLDKIRDQHSQKKGSLVWRPSGNIKQDVEIQVAVLKQEKLKVLMKTLGDLEAQNKLLREKVGMMESQLMLTKDNILACTKDLEQMVDMETQLHEGVRSGLIGLSLL